MVWHYITLIHSSAGYMVRSITYDPKRYFQGLTLQVQRLSSPVSRSSIFEEQSASLDIPPNSCRSATKVQSSYVRLLGFEIHEQNFTEILVQGIIILPP